MSGLLHCDGQLARVTHGEMCKELEVKDLFSRTVRWLEDFQGGLKI